MEPKRIYLDTNQWITLARVVNGSETDPDLIEVYQKIKKLSDSEEAIFPISFFHLEDMMIHKNKDRLEGLIDFMVTISRGWVIRPYNLLMYEEISNAALHRLGRQSFYDIRSKMIARGLPHAISTGYEITWNKSAKVPENFEQKLKEITESPESTSKLLKSNGMSNHFQQGRKLYIDTAKKMEESRTKNLMLKNEERYNAAIADYIYNIVGELLEKFLSGATQDVIGKVIPKTKSEMEAFLEDMPATNIVFRLTYGRDGFYQREIQTNDITDVNHLSGAIPYCDIVVMERMFASLSQQLKLDKKYGCTVLRSLKELNKMI
ncbi:hypothetical protein [Candidatus Nitrosotenuis cloacae]|uniref:hypothetical protein n=1 Tax=Candidatus Nitrosotenuis cloacae TaxID=1603555 RepID=UPI0022820AB7|nr:hypothetical protein [Candidatus Nitrosotenuis cloacae]